MFQVETSPSLIIDVGENQKRGVIMADDDPDQRYMMKRNARGLIADGVIADLSTVPDGESVIRRVTDESPGYYQAAIFDWDMGARNLNGVDAIRALYRKVLSNGHARELSSFKSVLYSSGPRGEDSENLIRRLTEELIENPIFLGAIHKDVPHHALLMHVGNALSDDPNVQESARAAIAGLTAEFYKKIGALDMAPDFIKAVARKDIRACLGA